MIFIREALIFRSSLQACNFIKKDTPKQTFSCEIYEVFKSIYFEEHLRTTASLNSDV